MNNNANIGTLRGRSKLRYPRRVKILFTRFPLESIPHGGAETQVLSLATGLRERKHAVAFAGSCPALLESFQNAGLMNAECDVGPPPVSKTAIARFALRKKKMKAQLEEMLHAFGKLDVVIMLSLTEKLLLTDIAHKKGMRVIWIEHDPVGRWLTSNPWKKLLLKQSALATTVTVSELSREQYLDMGFDRTKTVAIPNGIADRWFTKPATVREKAPTLHLGCVARLAKEKGVDLLIKAVAKEFHVRLDIVGDGPEKGALEHFVAQHDLTHRVRFLKRQDDLAAFYRELDALVLPSRTNDPFGMVAAEAMAMGVPCLVTDACGIASHLQPDDAVVVKHDSMLMLEKGIERLHNHDLRKSLSKNGRKAAKLLFTLEQMVDAYEKVL